MAEEFLDEETGLVFPVRRGQRLGSLVVKDLFCNHGGGGTDSGMRARCRCDCGVHKILDAGDLARLKKMFFCGEFCRLRFEENVGRRQGGSIWKKRQGR